MTDSVDPAGYWRKLKQRLKQEGNETVTNCNGLKLRTRDGKYRMNDVVDVEGMFRIIDFNKDYVKLDFTDKKNNQSKWNVILSVLK